MIITKELSHRHWQYYCAIVLMTIILSLIIFTISLVLLRYDVISIKTYLICSGTIFIIIGIIVSCYSIYHILQRKNNRASQIYKMYEMIAPIVAIVHMFSLFVSFFIICLFLLLIYKNTEHSEIASIDITYFLPIIYNSLFLPALVIGPFMRELGQFFGLWNFEKFTDKVQPGSNGDLQKNGESTS